MIDEYLEPTEREQKLPGWARETLSHLRSHIRVAEEQLAEAQYAAKARAGDLNPHTAAVVLDVPGADSVGLPNGTEVTFRLPDGGMLSVSHRNDGILIDANAGDLIVRPQNAAFQIVVEPAPTEQMTSSSTSARYDSSQRQQLEQKPGRW